MGTNTHTPGTHTHAHIHTHATQIPVIILKDVIKRSLGCGVAPVQGDPPGCAGPLSLPVADSVVTENGRERGGMGRD